MYYVLELELGGLLWSRGQSPLLCLVRSCCCTFLDPLATLLEMHFCLRSIRTLAAFYLGSSRVLLLISLVSNSNLKACSPDGIT